MSAYYTVNFGIASNEDLRQSFQLTDDAGAPLDLTGATFEMGVEDGGRTRVIDATIANGMIVVTAAATGNFELRIPATTLRTLPDGAYPHDLIWTKAGVTKRVWQGVMSLDRGIAG